MSPVIRSWRTKSPRRRRRSACAERSPRTTRQRNARQKESGTAFFCTGARFSTAGAKVHTHVSRCALFDRIRDRAQGIAARSASAQAIETVNHHLAPAKPATAGKAAVSTGATAGQVSRPLIETLENKEVIALLKYAREGKGQFKALAKAEERGKLAANYIAFT